MEEANMPVLTPHCPENGVLRPRQEAAALALARGLTNAEAAAAARVSERTVKVWATKPYLRHRVCQLRGQLTSQALGQLVNDSVSASDTLGFLSRMAKSETVRLGAARAILELATKLRETTELEQRIADLEEGLHGQPTRPA
jgi:hypothetical protein